MVMAMIVAMTSQLAFQLPLAYLLSWHTELNAQALWWSFPITNIVFAALSLWLFLRGDWQNARLRWTALRNRLAGQGHLFALGADANPTTICDQFLPGDKRRFRRREE